MSTTSQQALKRREVKVRLHPDAYESVRYWADRVGLSVNEYVVLAVEEKIGRANGDYDLPALEVQRLNQIIDEVQANSKNLVNLERVVVNGFDSLLGLTRGDSYLLDQEDGELEDPDLEHLLDDDGADTGVAGGTDVDSLRDGFGGGW